jgi:excisionase family DNA binding protein
MKIEIITKEDLLNFKTEVLSEIKSMLTDCTNKQEYLTSKEVCKYLNISATKLYELRSLGKIPFKKIGGSYRYNKNEIVNHFTK